VSFHDEHAPADAVLCHIVCVDMQVASKEQKMKLIEAGTLAKVKELIKAAATLSFAISGTAKHTYMHHAL
jgi:hypothetical protein